MWLPKSGGSDKKSSGNGNGNGNGLVALAIDKDKGSQHALKWVVSNLLSKGQTLVLIHVLHKPTTSSYASLSGFNFCEVNHSTQRQQLEKQAKELFLTFHCYCTRKDVQCIDILLEDTDIVKALVEYVSNSAIENLVLGASSRHGFIKRFKVSDIPSNVSKAAPDFCTVYVISKGKVSSTRNASRSAPFSSPLHDQIHKQSKLNRLPSSLDSNSRNISFNRQAAERASRRLREPRNFHDDNESVRSTFSRRKVYNEKLCSDLLESDSDFSFVSSARPSVDRTCPYDTYIDSGRTSRVSTSSGSSFGSLRVGGKWVDLTPGNDFSSPSADSARTSSSSQCTDDVENEMRRLRLELKQTMDMYSTACKEAIEAKHKAMELHRWRMEEERRLEEARLAEEAALAIAEREKAKCKAAIESAEAAQRIAELEAQMRANAEKKVQIETQQKRLSDKLASNNCRYRRYTIDEIEVATEYFQESRKIGEGGYGPVFKCYLDHTPAAVKILRPDAAQGRAQFQQEVEVLSCIRHPNMVLLLGACPEYGCLVYEYMANGSLDDLLFRRGNTPPLSWQLRFRSAAEIATGLLFLHQTKPEPIVHRDLKPANILLDHNYVSKIGDVGLARLVPPSVADEVTQYRMTSTAGTFCYIDPEYQQTGMLGIKSDVYSLGILLLQLVTGKPAMGLAHHVGRALEKGTFVEMLDPAVPDWPVEEALVLAKIAVQCAQLMRKDRPDLGKVVLPELNRLRELAAKCSNNFKWSGSVCPSPNHSNVSAVSQDVLSDPQIIDSGFESLKSHSSLSSTPEEFSGTAD